MINLLIMKGLDLKKRRELNGLTQQELADLVPVSKRTVINWEQSEEISASKVKLIQSVFKAYENESVISASDKFKSENDEIERLKEVENKPYKLDHYHEIVELGLRVVANWEELKKLDIVKNCIELDVLKAELQRQKEKDLN